MSDIKLDQVGGISLATIQLQKPTATTKPIHETVQSEDVAVTNHLSRLIHLLGVEESTPENVAKVAAMKRLIESGQYQVDVNALSEKLLNSGLLTVGE